MNHPFPEAETRFVSANGLRHHVIEWPSEGETVLLAHGFLDQGWSYAMVARRLHAAGYRVLCWDWRGHGKSEWCGGGAYYHFHDYVRDLDGLVEAFGEPFHLVGHSMGGTICSMYAALRPERLKTLTLIEGLGPPERKAEDAADKAATWLKSLERYAGRKTRSLSLEEAVERMRLSPRKEGPLTPSIARFLAEEATRPLDEGGRTWRFDPLHRTTSPTLFLVDSFASFLRRIHAPTLLVAGDKGFRLPDEAQRSAHIQQHRAIELENVGHMIHWHAPEALSESLLEHFRLQREPA